MTTGEKLVLLSTIDQGTALEHLIHIETSQGGDCTGEFINIKINTDSTDYDVVLESKHNKVYESVENEVLVDVDNVKVITNSTDIMIERE